MASILEWSDPHTEQALLGELSLQEPWALIERFSGLVRESGTEDERRAAAYVAGRLEGLGIPHQVHTPTLYISLPRGAGLTVLVPQQRTLHAKTPSFSVSTGDTSVQGSVVYLPSGFAQSDAALFEGGVRATAAQVAGRIALTEDLPTPRKVADLGNLGAAGAIFISPGERIHEGISTSIWGAPDLDSDGRQPRIPIVSVNRPDGTWLTGLCQEGPVEVALQTRLEQGWMPCPLVVAEIAGTEEPERFVLVHGHIDSWHVGIGDNATGDAALLELARVFHGQRRLLKRSIRIAWWPGHSTGRYAGSTWYADRFGLDLMENCIAQVNIDSPGCRWATAYLDIDWTPEADAFAKRAIRDATGLPAEGERPVRAGDYSFNNIGLTSFFMLLSTMPPEARAERGYYVVGGCGGNIAWHTEDDTLEIADRDNLLRDLRVYVTAISRAANAPLHPFDFRAHAADIAATLRRYAALAGGRVDLSPALAEANGLQATLERFYAGLDGAVDGARLARANAVQRELARRLIPINFSRAGLFRHDPALEQPPLPDLAPVEQLGATAPGSHQAHVLATHLVRGHNRVAWTLGQARRLVESAL
ncbi:MAG TPA: M28 family metallopeptidase [Chloroflexota bacterium]|nr:M28 family metallopeptidase [Chloroflexota bacterium]